MQTQTVFRAGNSNVVTIPTNLMKELNIKVGEKVMVEKSPTGNGLLVKKTNSRADDDFKNWVKVFIKENKETLDDLALR